MIEFCGTFVSPCTLEYTFSDSGIDVFWSFFVFLSLSVPI